jgi:cell division protein ZipA
MNELRLILLGIGLSIILLIYLWGTFKQKSQDRAHTRKITSFKRDSVEDVNAMPRYDEVDDISAEAPAEMDAFLANPEAPDINASDFSLPIKTAMVDEVDLNLSKAVKLSDQKKQSQDIEEDESREQDNESQIIKFLIKAAPGKTFFGDNILAATNIVGLKFGDMNIFHHYGVEGMESEESIFSLASMYEPGYFDLDNMETFQTKGLTLFMQLPAPMDNIQAFDLMQETAMRLTDMLQGEIWSSKNYPIDTKTLQAMRDIIAESP